MSLIRDDVDAIEYSIKQGWEITCVRKVAA